MGLSPTSKNGQEAEGTAHQRLNAAGSTYAQTEQGNGLCRGMGRQDCHPGRDVSCVSLSPQRPLKQPMNLMYITGSRKKVCLMCSDGSGSQGHIRAAAVKLHD